MKLLGIITVIISMFLSSSCAIYHHYGSYHGKVIDEETKKPLEGVVVLAEYVTWQILSPGGPTPYFLDTQEVITDRNGEFKIPTLNAFAFRPLSTFTMLGSEYGPFSPYFTIFKPHYKCSRSVNVPEDQYWEISLRELKTKEERWHNTDCYPTSVPNKKMKKLIEVNNLECIEVGQQPSHLK